MWANMSIHNLSEDPEKLKIESRDLKIRQALDGARENMVDRIVAVLSENNREDFEGFAMTAVDDMTGQNAIALSYVSQIKLDFDPLIRGTQAEIFLKHYYHDLFRKMVKDRGLVIRANHLLKQKLSNKEVAGKLNEVFAVKISGDIDRVKEDFAKIQGKMLEILRSEFVNIDNREERVARALTMTMSNNINMPGFAAIGESVTEILTKPGVFSQIVQTIDMAKIKKKERIDPIQLSNLLYTTRQLVWEIEQESRGEKSQIVADGYIRHAMDMYLQIYNIYLQEYVDLEEQWVKNCEAVEAYNSRLLEMIDQRPDRNLFLLERGRSNDIINRLNTLKNRFGQHNDKIGLPIKAMEELLRQNLTEKNHWSEFADLNLMTGSLGKGIKEENHDEFIKEVNKNFDQKGKFLNDSKSETEAILAEIKDLLREIRVKKNFLDLPRDIFKSDFFNVAYNQTRLSMDLMRTEADEILLYFENRAKLLFLNRLEKFTHALVDLGNLTDLSRQYAEKIIMQINGFFHDLENGQEVEVKEKEVREIIKFFNVICRDILAERARKDKKIVVIANFTKTLKVRMLEHIRDFESESKKADELFF